MTAARTPNRQQLWNRYLFNPTRFTFDQWWKAEWADIKACRIAEASKAKRKQAEAVR